MRGVSGVLPNGGTHHSVASMTGGRLLYVSEGGANAVNVYSFPEGVIVGRLTRLSQPSGLCTDASGAIWIVESSSSAIVKYAHGGTTPIATLNDTAAVNLLSCSVDPVSGDLAVTDTGGPAGRGSVWVYAGATGKPKRFRNPNIPAAYFCGYDNAGNLFVDGLNPSHAFVLFELAKGATALQPVALNKAVGFPGGVRWDGQYLAIGDQYYQQQHKSAIYQVTVSGLNGSVVATTALDACDVLEFGVTRAGARSHQKMNRVIAPDICNNTVGFYHYPSGGAAIKSLPGVYPVGAEVSDAN